jgi:putative radical SAM enzyme (TIGR03279 family)
VIAELPVITAVADGSVAQLHGLCVGDQVISINGIAPRDLIEWQSLVADYPLEIEVKRGNQEILIAIESRLGDDQALPFGVDVHSALFDRVQTCDNHCEFCFIYQLPKGMRRSLYLKDDDYRLSFLYGNFTTLTRFTEADLERVITQNLSPLYVSVHATRPQTRADMLRNDRGGVSLRWLRQLLDHGIDVRAQIVLCPGVNDGEVLNETFGTLLEEMSEISSVAVVPLGLSKYNTESRMRVHSSLEAKHTLSVIRYWQERYQQCLGRHVIHAADELYLVAGEQVPDASLYSDFGMLEDGVGLVRTFVDSFHDVTRGAGLSTGASSNNEMLRDGGFFASVDKDATTKTDRRTDYVRATNPAIDTSLRAVNAFTDHGGTETQLSLAPTRQRARTLGVITGSYGAQVITPIVNNYLSERSYEQLVTVHEIPNEYFGGNTAVAGLMTFEDIALHLRQLPEDRLYILPDVCLNDGRFLDGKTIDDLRQIRNVRVIASTGSALRAQIDLFMRGVADDHTRKQSVSHG